MILPDYAGGGFANLIASCIAAAGGVARHPTALLAPPELLRQARNIVLLLIDGLGYEYLSGPGRGSALAAKLSGRLSSVFPSTTASAITTSYTGWTPIEHGLTGWYTYFSEIGGVAAALPGKRRGTEAPLTEDAARAIYCAPPLFDSLERRAIVVTYRPIVDSAYNRHHCGTAERRAYDDLAGLVAETEAAVKSGDDAKFVYAYWPQFDTTAHRYGVDSSETASQFRAIDEAFADLLARLAGTQTLLVASADHGFIDSHGDESLELPEQLAALLRHPLCGERRVAFCHVREPDEFTPRARDWLGARADVRPSRELLAEGWFGRGEAHPQIAGRVGDVSLVMRGRYTIKDWLPGEKRYLHIGNHGGTSAEEMYVPLILAEA